MDLDPHYLLDLARGCYARARRCDDADARDGWIALGARYEAVYAGETVDGLPGSLEGPDGLSCKGPLLPVPG